MRQRFFLGSLACLLAVSCSVQELDVKDSLASSDEVFYASLESYAAPETRVYVDENVKILWDSDDRISIFNKYTYNQEYRFAGATGSNAGAFKKVPTDDFVTGNDLEYVYAVYPYQEGTSISNSGVLSLELPASQEYRDGSFGLGSNTMVSVTEDNQLKFRNVGGYLVLKFYGEGVSVSSIKLEGNNGELLSGQGTIKQAIGGTPSLTMSSSAGTSITLTSETPVELGSTKEEATPFWLVVPPTSFSKGFTLTVTASDGREYIKETSANLSITRNGVLRISPIEVVLTDVLSIGENGNWFLNGIDTEMSATNQDDECFVPNPETGYFDKYVDGEMVTYSPAVKCPDSISSVWDAESESYTVYGVDGINGGYVISLACKLRGLVFCPQVYIDGIQGMVYQNYAFMPKSLNGKDSSNEIQIDKANAKEVNMSTGLTVQYHVNPTNADLSFLVEGESTALSFIKEANVNKIETKAFASEDFNVTPIFKSVKDGILTVDVQVTGIPATGDLVSVLALQVEREDGIFVTSDYAALMKQDFGRISIASPNAYAKTHLEVQDAHYRRASIGIPNIDGNAYIPYSAWITDPTAAYESCDVAVKYNSSLDLKTIVAAHRVSEDGTDACFELSAADLEVLGLTWEFEVVKNYKVYQNGSYSDQANYVMLEGGVFTPRSSSLSGEDVIGRTPIIRVALKHGDDVIEYAYIKVFITDVDTQ